MTIERWQTFSKHNQLLNIGSAIMRASNWQDKDKEKFLMAVEEALKLLELSKEDPKWEARLYALDYLRIQIEKFKRAERKDNIKILYQVL